MLSHSELIAEHGRLWNTEELQNDFEVLSFLAPFVSVIRKEDRQRGSLQFQHDPRYYFCFTPSK